MTLSMIISLLTSWEMHIQACSIQWHQSIFWQHVDLEYKIKKPKLRRKPGRPRKTRIKASDEPSARKRKRFPECHELGHTTKKCQGGLTARQKRGTGRRSSTTESSKYVIHVYSFLVSYTLNRFMPHPILDIYWCIFTTLFWRDGATNVGGRPPTGRERGRGRGRGASRLAALLNV